MGTLTQEYIKFLYVYDRMENNSDDITQQPTSVLQSSNMYFLKKNVSQFSF